jgi:peptide/nickel transport system permease protein
MTEESGQREQGGPGSPGHGELPPAPPDGPTYSKDYWDLVFEQLGRRRLFQLAMALLALLYASAIYAPLLANDRPYYLEAIDVGAYEAAHRTLYPVTLGMGRLLKETPEEYLEGRTEGSTQAYEQALEAERSALAQRLDDMRRYLPAEEHGPLDALSAKLDEAIAAAKAGEAERALELHGEAKDMAKAVRAEFAPLQPDAQDEGSAPPVGKRLVGAESWPLFETISWVEAYFMLLWVLVLAWPAWNRLVNRLALGGDRARIRRHRRTKWAAVLLLPLAGAVVWGATVGGSPVFAVAGYKQALTDEEIVATRVVFPPIALGFAETHPSENFRPPTWTSLSDISEEGYYVRGPRKAEPDPVTGFMQPPSPVDVRAAEPERNSPWRHLLGTDGLGRDLMVRLLYGGRVSLSIGLVSAFLLVVIGTIIGSIAGYFGKRVDLALSRFIEVVLCFPAFYLILFAAAMVDPEQVAPIVAITIIIALVRWTGVARLARGEFLRLRELDFVVASRALGFSSARTIFRHILPNALGPILVAGAFAVAAGILTESTVSYLGFGVQHPVPSWGSLINESKSPEHWWIQVFPGALIFATVVCYNLVGEALRDALDPKMRKERS